MAERIGEELTWGDEMIIRLARLTNMSQRHQVPLLATAICLVAPACGETIDPSGGGFEDSASYGGGGGGDTSSETGGIPADVGLGELDPGECIADPKDGVWGYKYQCGGYFMAHIGFIYNGEPGELWIPRFGETHFGDGQEPYQEAKVMACCGQADLDVSIWEQPPAYAENCLLDFRQQACFSMATGLATLINDGTVPDLYKSKAIDIQHFLAQHIDECIAGLLHDEDDDSPSYLENARWELPDDGPWSSHLDDVFVEVDFALINGLYQPEQPDVCTSLNSNDGNVFTPPPAPLINVFDVDLDEGGGGIVGPNRITASAPFASLATDCRYPYCSTATLSTDGSDFSIDQMLLYVDGDLRVSNGVGSEVISNARLELYGSAQGSVTGGGRLPTLHTIPVGQAQFLVVGHAIDEWVTIPVMSSTPIVAHEVGGSWSLDAFALEYVDDSGSTWTVQVDQSDWL